MSDYMDDDEPVGADAEQDKMLEAAVDALRMRYETGDLEDKLRKIGVYVEDHMIMPIPTPHGMKVTLALRGKVNRTAFTDRVLDPDKHAMDRQFQTMALSAQDDIFIDTRERIKKNIAEGRDPLDDGDEDVNDEVQDG